MKASGRKLLVAALSTATLVGFSQTSQAAVQFLITGDAVPAFNYSSTPSDNNVINAPGAPLTQSSVQDLSGSAFWRGSTASLNSFVSVTGLTGTQQYNVSFSYLGNEAGDRNTFTVGPAANIVVNGAIATDGDNRNNSLSGSSQSGPLGMGSVTYQDTVSGIPGFTLTDARSGTTVTNGGTNAPPKTGGVASLIFAYVVADSNAADNANGIFWTLSAPGVQTANVVFGFNDDGSGDDNHDDFVGIMSVVLPGTPIPGALPLFGSAVGALGLLGWRRKRKSAAA